MPRPRKPAESSRRLDRWGGQEVFEVSKAPSNHTVFLQDLDLAVRLCVHVVVCLAVCRQRLVSVAESHHIHVIVFDHCLPLAMVLKQLLQ